LCVSHFTYFFTCVYFCFSLFSEAGMQGRGHAAPARLEYRLNRISEQSMVRIQDTVSLRQIVRRTPVAGLGNGR
jgi:hypothetical protein